VRRLAEQDHAEENQADDQHPRDYALAFRGRISEQESDSHDATLAKSAGVRGERVLER